MAATNIINAARYQYNHFLLKWAILFITPLASSQTNNAAITKLTILHMSVGSQILMLSSTSPFLNKTKVIIVPRKTTIFAVKNKYQVGFLSKSVRSLIMFILS
ncbi:MAG: hypothetical protein MJ223_02045 [Mycoplasmoidaceae bacterium]|nr:hypothetical protein [Mycoplasmoidaceae bacterium]